MADALLGMDVGTSSSKGVLAEPDGTVVATVELPHDTDFPQPGFVEHDPEKVWWGDFTRIVHELLDQADGHEVKGVSVSGIGACTLPPTSTAPRCAARSCTGSTPGPGKRSTR